MPKNAKPCTRGVRCVQVVSPRALETTPIEAPLGVSQSSATMHPHANMDIKILRSCPGPKQVYIRSTTRHAKYNKVHFIPLQGAKVHFRWRAGDQLGRRQLESVGKTCNVVESVETTECYFLQIICTSVLSHVSRLTFWFLRALVTHTGHGSKKVRCAAAPPL